MEETTIWTSSACQPNPGPGGYAVTITMPDGTVEKRNGGRRFTTNTRMELFAAISGLMRLKGKQTAEIKSSSYYLINGINKRKADLPNSDLWNRLDPLLNKHKVTATWHRARSTEENAEAYSRALQEAKGSPAKPDTGYEAYAGEPAKE